MKIFNGKEESEKILNDLKKKIQIQEQKKGIKPRLAVVSVGKNPASELFVKNKQKAAEYVGVEVILVRFSGSAKEEKIINEIARLNEDSNVHGIILQMPLPKGLNTAKAIKKIATEKDVDGFRRNTLFSPPLISAILLALNKVKKDIKNKKILAIVNSDIFGDTLKIFLKKQGLKIDYLLSKYAIEKNHKIRTADIIITALGKPKFIKGDMIKNGAMLIDAGIVVKDKGKVVGDIDRETVSDKAAFLTPVPGGIGPLTVAFLLKNVFLAYLWMQQKKLTKRF